MKLYAKKRMRKLIELLRTVKPKAFSMGLWLSHRCGTAGCMGGYACTIPSFKKAGLKLRPIHPYCQNEFYPEFKGNLHFSAIQVFFDLTNSEAHELFTADKKNNFYCDQYVDTPKQGARRLERFLKFKEKECLKSQR